ncbi:MAG: hypothetical protein ABIK77_04315 [candidate division WOR-3 bacterium]|uniref:Uncharacterized protein n=1 Tax=candidate division WOR-3 bacterium TaxID=2052148 RepID=A0A7V4FDR3_UNCW3
MSSLWEKVKNWLEDTTKQVLKETEDLSKKGRLKMQISSLNREIDKKFSYLGGLVYQLINEGKTDIAEDEKVKEVILEIKKLEEELKLKEEEYKKV